MQTVDEKSFSVDKSIQSRFNTVFAKINAHPKISTHLKQKPIRNSDFSKGGVRKTDGLWWGSFQRGKYTKPMGFDGWFFKEGSTQNRWGFDEGVFKGGSTQNRWALMGDFSKRGVHKTDGFWWGLNFFSLPLNIKSPGRLFRQIRYVDKLRTTNVENASKFVEPCPSKTQRVKNLPWSCPLPGAICS